MGLLSEWEVFILKNESQLKLTKIYSLVKAFMLSHKKSQVKLSKYCIHSNIQLSLVQAAYKAIESLHKEQIEWNLKSNQADMGNLRMQATKQSASDFMFCCRFQSGWAVAPAARHFLRNVAGVKVNWNVAEQWNQNQYFASTVALFL